MNADAVTKSLAHTVATVEAQFAWHAFLGIGTDPSQGNWGSMLFEYRTFTLDDPMLMVPPGLCIDGAGAQPVARPMNRRTGVAL